MARLAVEGTREIHYDHHKGGDGTPVVLVHGWGMNGRVWDYVLPYLLQAGHDVVVADQRACGRSDRDFTDVGIEALGSDVVALVEHLGLAKVVLNGWSLGGARSEEGRGGEEGVSPGQSWGGPATLKKK